MGKRNINFIRGEYYHVYNRGVDKRDVFLTKSDYFYFLKRLIDLNQKESNSRITTLRSRNKDMILKNNSEKLVNIIAYNLLPNHFHLILSENVENGISLFMQKLGTSYTKYFNIKNDRNGSLFQGKFKAKMITGNLALPILSVYVNLNHRHHNLEGNYSSFHEYISNKTENKISICNKEDIKKILEEINPQDYLTFAKKTSQFFCDNKEKQNYVEFNE